MPDVMADERLTEFNKNRFLNNNKGQVQKDFTMQQNYIEDLDHLESAQSVQTYINHVELKKCAPDTELNDIDPNEKAKQIELLFKMNTNYISFQ